MSNIQHTPGPWSYDTSGVKTFMVFNEDEKLVASSICSEADAALLAAAPALLEALRTIVANASSVQFDPQWAVQVARAAIRQATGQE